jgi:hypothetical protein
MHAISSKTDNNYTDANILWNETEEAVKTCMKETKTAVCYNNPRIYRC